MCRKRQSVLSGVKAAQIARFPVLPHTITSFSALHRTIVQRARRFRRNRRNLSSGRRGTAIDGSRSFRFWAKLTKKLACIECCRSNPGVPAYFLRFDAGLSGRGGPPESDAFEIIGLTSLAVVREHRQVREVSQRCYCLSVLLGMGSVWTPLVFVLLHSLRAVKLI